MKIKVFASFLLILLMFGASFAHEKHGNKNANANCDANANTPANANGAASHPEHPAEDLPTRQPVSEFPTLHPLIVHFPIMLILLAAVLQVVSFLGFRREMCWIVLTLTTAGVVTAWLSSNVYHPHTTGLSESAQRLLSEHELYAGLTFWFALAAVIVKGVSVFLKRPWWSEVPATVLLAVAATTVSIAGHHGAELVHKEGVGPQGQFLEAEHDH